MVWTLLRDGETDPAEVLRLLYEMDRVLGLRLKQVKPAGAVVLSDEDSALLEERIAARQAKNWSRADEIRDHFLKKGLSLKDTPDGTVVSRDGL